MNRIKALSQGLVALHYDNPQEDYHKEQQFAAVMNKAFPYTPQDFEFRISASGYYYADKTKADVNGLWNHSKDVDIISYPVDVFIEDFLDNIIEILKDEPKQDASTEHQVKNKHWDWRSNMPLTIAMIWVITYAVRLHFNPDVTGWFISAIAFALCIVIGILCKKLFR